jgi:hypothetical protein
LTPLEVPLEEIKELLKKHGAIVPTFSKSEN